MKTYGTRMSPASGLHASNRFEHDSNSNALSASTPNCRSGDRLNWEMLALWVFVAFSFAALVFAGYVIWAKCASPSSLYVDRATQNRRTYWQFKQTTG